MAYSFLNVVSALTVFLLIILASVLLTSNKSTTSARILSVFLLAHALMIAGEMINHSEFVLGRPGLALWTVSLPLLFGPLLWLYTNDVLFRNFNYNKRILWHFVPFTISLLLLIVFYQLPGYNDKLTILKGYRELTRHSLPTVATSIIMFGTAIVYIALCFRKIRYYRKELLNQFSTIETIDVKWLISMLSIYCLLIFLLVLNSITGISSYSYLNELTFISLIFAFAVLFSSIFYRALTFPNFFKGITYSSRDIQFEMSKEDQLEAMGAIDKVVLEDALYTKAYMNIHDLEEKCGYTTDAIITLLKNEKNMTYFEYINRMRVELAKRLLTDPGLKNVSELEIMYDCGYNTRSSFYHYFKQYTEKRPDEMRNEAP